MNIALATVIGGLAALFSIWWFGLLVFVTTLATGYVFDWTHYVRPARRHAERCGAMYGGNDGYTYVHCNRHRGHTGPHGATP